MTNIKIEIVQTANGNFRADVRADVQVRKTETRVGFATHLDAVEWAGLALGRIEADEFGEELELG